MKQMNRSDCEQWILAMVIFFGWGDEKRVGKLWENRPQKLVHWTLENFTDLYYELKAERKLKPA
jgi:hypothetical protein